MVHCKASLTWGGGGFGEGVAVPQSLGNASYPSWLTSDSRLGPDNVPLKRRHGMRYEGRWENSPDTLQLYRSVYAGFMETHQSASLTTKSLLYDSVDDAASDPFCMLAIVEKIFGAVVGKVQESADDENKLADLDLREVLWALDEGRLSEHHLELLKIGFEQFLQQSHKLFNLLVECLLFVDALNLSK